MTASLGATDGPAAADRRANSAARLGASPRSAVAAFQAMRVLEAANARRAAGGAVYDLSVGQPSTPAPEPVRRAAAAALRTELIGYTAALGLPRLREAIAAHYRRGDGIEVDPASVGITTGSSGAFLLAFLSAFSAGDEVVLARPGYPAYRNMLSALGCTVVEVPCGPSTGFRLGVEQLEALPSPPAGMVLASPANPTGTVTEPQQLQRLSRWCAEHGVRLVSDEIYHGIGFGPTVASAWRYGREALVVSSFSKYFSMTGWRIGWLLMPDELVDAIDRLAGNFALCPPTLSQHAAAAAFDAYDELDANVARYARNRELLLHRLPQIGIDRWAPADGAFYLYLDVSRWTTDSLPWVARVLAETGVALTPGVDFDQLDGNNYVRLCFAGDTAQLATAVDVLGEWLAGQPELG